MPNNNAFATSVNELLGKLEDNPTIDTGIELANQIVTLFGEVNTKSVEDVFESSLELPNAERYDSWFQPHPIFKSDRACFDLADAPLLQAKFYWLKKRSRQILAGGVHFTPNFEDEEFTHNERYKVGLDFFLSPNGKSLQVVLSNRGNLRIVELSGRLNNTQKEIFEKWIGAGSLKSQEALHTTLWESFKLKSVNQKFYDGVSNSFTELLQHLESIDKDEEEAKLFASRLLGRLLFCWFLRKKGIIDESVGYFNAQGADATAYYKQSLERLFFLTLNTPIDERDELTKQHQRVLFPELLVDDQPSLFKTDQKTPYLNGGLFEPHENDWYTDDSLTLPEGFFTNLYDHFEEFNFTTDESSPEYEQIAIDPEMLGRVFESLLATQVDETGQQARKAKGAFYTPREIVSYMCKESLRNYLYNSVNDDESIKESIDSLLDISDSEWAKSKSNTLRDKVKDNRTQIIDALDAVTIIDPACGSGAYPMGMLQLMLKTYERLESRFDPYKTKLSVIQNNIFGVDIEPMAVEISRLRAWLSLIVDEDDPRSVDPLPNLDFKFVCANSLIPLDKEMGLFSDTGLHQKLKDIRTKYFNARKKHTKKALQDEYYQLTSSEQTSLITDDNRTKQLKSFNPFKNSSPAQFYDNDHMFGIQDGFSIAIGNPPYGVSITGDLRKEVNSSLGKVPDFEIYYYFLELSSKLLAENGIVSYIIPNTYLFNVYAAKYRLKLLEDWDLKLILDCSAFKLFDAATVHNTVNIFQKNTKKTDVTGYKITQNAKSFSELANRETTYISNDLLLENNSNWGLAFKLPIEILDLVKTIKRAPNKLSDLFPEFSQGLIAYDKYRGQSDDIIKNRAYHYSEKTKPGLKEWLKGEDVTPYSVQWNGNEYIDYCSDIANPRNPKFFNGKRLLVREITNPKIYAAITNEELYHDPALIVVLDNVNNIDPLLAILNSKLASFYHFNSSPKATKGSFPKILINDIRNFPIPNWAEAQQLAKLVSMRASQTSNDKKIHLEKEIDRIVYKLYGLNEAQVQIVEDAIK